MVKLILICYNFEKINPSNRKQFDRELFGTVEKSHKRKYTSITKGILTDQKYERPVRSVILFESNMTLRGKIINILKKYGAKYFVFLVVKS